MKIILLFTLISALNTSFFIPAYATINDDNGTTPHVDGNVQFPPIKWQVVRHTIRLHVPKNSKAVSQLLINVPDNITLSRDINNIRVFNENEQIINSNVSVNGKTIQIDFSQPMTSDTKFSIELNHVKRRNIGNSSIYRLFVKEVGINQEISIGVAQFRIY